MSTETIPTRTATVDIARLEYLLRALEGAVWRIESHGATMEHACDNADDVPSLKRVLKEDMTEASFVASSAITDICNLTGIPEDDKDPHGRYNEYRMAWRIGKHPETEI